MDFATLRKAFPAMRDSMPVEIMRFEQVLESNFDLVAKEGRFELRHRRENASEVECDGIVH
jgi:hypothetical protein